MTQDLGDGLPARPIRARAADDTVFHEIVGSRARDGSAAALRGSGAAPARNDSPADDFGATHPPRATIGQTGAGPGGSAPPAEGAGLQRVLLVLALVVVLAAAVLIGVLATRKPATHDAPRGHQAGPRVPRTEPTGHSLPGTIGLGTWHGSGNDVISPPAHQVEAGRELALTVLCNGSGPVAVGPVVNTDCSGSVTGAVDAGTALRLQVDAGDTTSWQFDLVDQPQSGTDGTLVALPNPALTTPPAQALGVHQGSGSADVPLGRAGAPGQELVDVRIVVTCKGNGLTISSTDGSVANQYTRTCFSGWSYEFDATSVRLPTTLRVTADQHTSWHLVAVRFQTG